MISNKILYKFFRHKYYYINENKVTIMCLAEELSDDMAFAFLYDIKKKLLNTYDYDKLSGYSSFQLSEFTEQLKSYMVKHILK
jgi:hypothetical protein